MLPAGHLLSGEQLWQNFYQHDTAAFCDWEERSDIWLEVWHLWQWCAVFYFHENWANFVLGVLHFVCVKVLRALSKLVDPDKPHLGPPPHTLCLWAQGSILASALVWAVLEEYWSPSYAWPTHQYDLDLKLQADFLAWPQPFLISVDLSRDPWTCS